LENGLQIFNDYSVSAAARTLGGEVSFLGYEDDEATGTKANQLVLKTTGKVQPLPSNEPSEVCRLLLKQSGKTGIITGEQAFKLYDTYGFPFDLTELMARERGLTVDKEGFEKLMEEQKRQSQAAQKKQVISLSQIETTTPTKFIGFEKLGTSAKVLEVVSLKDKTAIILDTSTAYAEMGGQVGDTGTIFGSSVTAKVNEPVFSEGADTRPLLRVTNTQKSGNTWLHFVEGEDIPAVGDTVAFRVDKPRRDAIQRHHTVTHLLHWALHEVVSKEASQKGSAVGPDKLTFDFNSAALTPTQSASSKTLVSRGPKSRTPT
jgi:alanyl-tRNA synthetase